MRSSAAGVPDALAPPPGNPRFPLLDALRGLAALAVVAFHADQLAGARSGTLLGRALAHLDVGVAVFFVLTGFLLYRPFVAAAFGQAPAPRATTFYARRVLRIVPAYWVALLALSIYPGLRLIDHGLVNAAFLQVLRPEWARSGIPPAWSVCVELSFYAVLPLYALSVARRWTGLDPRARCRRELILLAGLTVAALALRIAVIDGELAHRYLIDLLPGTIPWFAAGMALALVSATPDGGPARIRAAAAHHPIWCWLTALAIYVAVTLVTWRGGIEASAPLFAAYGAIALLLVAPAALGASARSLPGRVLSARPLPWLGLISYGIYLYHYPLMRELSHHLDAGPTPKLLTLAAAGAGAAIACGAASYYAIERPTLRLKRRLGTRIPAHASRAPAG